MTVYAITDTKKGEQKLRLLIFKLPQYRNTDHLCACMPRPSLNNPHFWCYCMIILQDHFVYNVLHRGVTETIQDGYNTQDILDRFNHQNWAVCYWLPAR